MVVRMVTRRKLRSLILYGLLGLVLVLLLATCDRTPSTPNGDRPDVPPAQPLPEVAALPDPTLPDWIEQISPLGEAETLAQIRIRFAEPLVPVESLESPDRTAVLEQFEVFPDIPGQFRFLTPRMVGFQGDRAIPKATRLRVTLKAGLADLAGHQLNEDLAWTFTTAPITISNLPGTEGNRGSENDPLELEPTLEFDANVPLDLASLRQHVTLSPDNQARSVAVRVVEAEYDDETLSLQEQFDASARPWRYHVTPQRSLDKGTTYRLSIAPGVRPAGGNLPTENPIDTSVITYGPLAFQGLNLVGGGRAEGAAGRFVNGLAELKFNNGLVADSATEHITVDPPPKSSPSLIRAYDNDPVVRLNPWALNPNTTYTITIDQGLEDRFGQTLEESVTVDYTPGDLTADLWAPTGLNIFPASHDLQLNLSAVNLPDGAYKAAYRVVQPTDLVGTDSAYPRGDRPNLLPDAASWPSFPVNAAKNEITDIAIPLRERLGSTTGMLAYGVTARTTSYDDDGQQRWREPDFYGLVQLTNLGVFGQWFSESGLVRVHHLSDGAPVQNAPVSVYRSYLYDETPPPGSPRPCATGTTDSTGTLNFDAADLQTCMGGAVTFADPPELLIVAREGNDWAFTRTRAYSGSYGYGINAGWNSTQPQSRGTIFSDRFLYQPGETAWLTGTAYYLQQGTLRQDTNTPYQVTLIDPEGNEQDLGTQTTNEFGTFSFQWDLSPDQPLGYYSVVAKSDAGVEVQGQLRVAEFKPPNFQTELSLERPVAIAGETLQAAVQSTYLFGAPVQGGTVNYYVTRRPTEVTPEGWDDFTFGRQWNWPEERPAVPSEVLETSQTLGNEGQSDLSVDIADDLPYPMDYRIDAEVVDVSNLSVADSQTVTALPEDRLIGLKNDFVAEAGTPFEVEVIVTDPDGQPLPRQTVNLVLERINYSSVTEVIEGSASPNYQVEYVPVDEASVRSGNAAKSVPLTAPEAGSYRVRATFANGDERSATDRRLWVTGTETVYWGDRYTNDRLEVQLDKDRYAPGETATALIQSPYEKGELYVAVVRHDRLYEQVIPVEGGAPQVSFTVTPEMLPNAAVEAVLIRQGDPLDMVEPNLVENLASVGFAPFNVEVGDRYLTPTITPTQPELRPATEQTLDFSLTDTQGQPVQGQLTVMVVDEAVLQLSGHRPPDLVDLVYADQDISTRFEDNRADVVLRPLSSPLEKGWGYGGGFSAGGESTRIRRDFQALAFYNGSVLTDDQGNAQVSFTLPDNLTTWRAMAVATDGNLRFGNSDATFITTQPLITAPVLPQFARPGDRLLGGLSVTNTSDQRGQLIINGTVTDSLAFTETDTGSSSSTVLDTRVEDGTQAYRFPLEVTGSTDAQVQFQTQLGTEGDGFQVSLPVVPLEITEQVVDAGTTTESVTIPLRVGENVMPDVGGLDVFLSSTLLTDIKAPVRQLQQTENLPNLSTAASRLAIAANLYTLSQQYGNVLGDFDALDEVTQAIDRIRPLQRPDGGFSSWPGFEQSDPFVTPYAARALAAAQTAGFTVDGSITSALQGYLSNLLTNPGQVDWCESALCKNQIRLEALIALADLGTLRQDFLADLHDQRDQFDTVSQIKLARHLSRFSNWQAEANALANQIQESVYETARTAAINLPLGWGWYHSPVTAQAETLELFVARNGSPDLLTRLVDGLLALRRDGTWQTSYDNAQALSALVSYAQLLPEPPNFEATVQLNGDPMARQRFQGYQQPSLEVSVPMAELPKGESNLVLDKTGEGMLHYLTAYRYRQQGNPPGRLQGLRVTRSIRPANESDILQQMGLTPMNDPVKLGIGQVFDIGLEIITDHAVNHVIITDPLPAGLEAVDTSFQTSTPYFQPQQDSWEIGYQTLERDRILAYGDRLDPGVYTLHYLVRSVTPGTFLWPGSEVQLEYAPEEFGRATAVTLEIQD
jgi:uncharacterized protein YfaS (alpha-2-macroglobulin family)